MVKLRSSEHHYSHPWSAVTAAVWQKYPNERTPHVISVDVLRRDVDEERKVLRTERLLTVKQGIPKFVLRLFGMSEPVSHVLEVSEISLTTQTYSSVSTNLALRDLFVMDEVLTYRPDPASPTTRTLVEQHACATATLARWGSYVEDLLISRFRDNAHVGRAALQSVIERVVTEGQLGLERVGHAMHVVAACEAGANGAAPGTGKASKQQ